MHAKIVYTDTLSSQQGVKAVVYGKAGSGKTRLIASCPRPLILSAERGLLSLRGHRIPAWPIASMKDMIEAYTWVMNSHEARNFDTIALDSASDLAEVLLSHEKSINPNKANGFKPYNELNEQFISMLRNFRALNQKHVYFICKEEYDKDDGGMMMYQPSMPGKQLSMQIPYLVDEIFRLVQFKNAQQQDDVCLQCIGTSTAIAKDRSGALAAYEPYDLGGAFRKIMGC